MRINIFKLIKIVKKSETISTILENIKEKHIQNEISTVKKIGLFR